MTFTGAIYDIIIITKEKDYKWHCHIRDVAGALDKIKLDVLWH